MPSRRGWTAAAAGAPGCRHHGGTGSVASAIGADRHREPDHSHANAQPVGEAALRGALGTGTGAAHVVDPVRLHLFHVNVLHAITAVKKKIAALTAGSPRADGLQTKDPRNR